MNLGEILDLDLNAQEKLLFLVFVRHADETGAVRMSIELAARQVGIEEAGVAEALQNLFKNKFLKEAPRKNGGVIQCYLNTTSSTVKSQIVLDFSGLPQQLRQPVSDLLGQAALERRLAQDLVDELAGRLRAGAVRNPLSYLAGLTRKALAGQFFFTQHAARQARHAAPTLKPQPGHRPAAQKPLPEKYLQDQRVQRLLQLGAAGREPPA
ncbi:MAG: hypothetical protein ACOY5C_14610 [Pseudomonadota bacterium]